MKVAFVIFNGMTMLDFVGIYDPVSRLKSMGFVPDMHLDFCAATPEVSDDRGLTVRPNQVGHPLSGYDLVIVAGGMATRTLYKDAAYVDWIRGAVSAPQLASVCTGALLLGAAGLLEGRRATTHPNAYEELRPLCAEVVRERIVDEGTVITAGGVTSGIDLGLTLVERYAGAEARARIAKEMDYPYGPAT